MKALFVLSVFAAALVVVPVSSAEAQSGSVFIQRLSPDQARDNVARGRHRSLDDLLPVIRAQVEGDLLRVMGLESRGSRTIYLLRWKGSSRLMDLEVDAETGEVLRVE